MTEMQFKNIKEKINIATTKALEANGKMLAIKEQWRSKYGFDTLEDAKKKLDEMKTDIEEKKKMRENLMDRLESSFDWESI